MASDGRPFPAHRFFMPVRSGWIGRRINLCINLCNEDDETPLMLAARNGWGSEAVGVLFSFGADPNVKVNKGHTALDYASEEADEEVLKVLQMFGAKHGHEMNQQAGEGAPTPDPEPGMGG